MNGADWSSLLTFFRESGTPLSTSLRRGLEKEGLRCTAEGNISQRDHPRELGCTLTHSWITTDYAEALLELITPVCDSVENAMTWLESLHAFVQSRLPEGEVLWNASMPCRLQGEHSIRIAEYGDSHLGRLKHIYRKGLEVRYGRIMQSIAGIHYNWSLTPEFWQLYAEREGSRQPLSEFRSARYFGLIRNFRRNSWLLMFLFGASPALDRSFVKQPPAFLAEDGEDTWMSPFATSLRMGDLGYRNDAQSGLFVCFNHLNSYIQTLHEATHIPHPPYEKLGTRRDGDYIQLNTNLLQIENEYYNSIRPKRVTLSGEKPLEALKRDGVEYIEVRCLDIDPFSPVGVTREQLQFMDLFLLHALLSPSPLLCDLECRQVDENFARVVAEGRAGGLHLTRVREGRSEGITLLDWATELLDSFQPLAEALDAESGGQAYQQALALARKRVSDPQQCPSARVLKILQKEGQGYVRWQLDQSRYQASQVTGDPAILARLEKEAGDSWEAEAALRASDQGSFDDYLKAFLAH